MFFFINGSNIIKVDEFGLKFALFFTMVFLAIQDDIVDDKFPSVCYFFFEHGIFFGTVEFC